MDELNKRKLILLHDGEIALFQQSEIAVAIQAADKAPAVFRPVRELFLNAVTHAVALLVGLVSDQLLIVVNENHACNRPGFLIFDADIVVIRDVEPVGNTHEGDVLVFIVVPDHIAVYPVTPVIHGKQ